MMVIPTHRGEKRTADTIRSDEHPIEYYLHERYREPGKKKLMQLYYGLRPFMPRGVQLALRRVYAKKQAQTEFPRWPIEPLLVERAERELAERIRQSAEGRVPLINLWPGNARAAVALTHDVEWEKGMRNIPRVRVLEKRYGVVSSWNFVGERYPLDKELFKVLEREGCEIGLHGVYHDGKKFSSRAVFEERLPKINAYLQQWGAVGFRSPATHRNPEWMPEIAAEYDSSFPDTDPFEPQSGGCCSIFPFFLGAMVELPITLVQDHTLIEILQEKDIRLWKEKASWIIEHHGLVNIIIHPDYMVTDRNLAYYEDFLRFITKLENLWLPLPREIARWWKDRAASRITTESGAPKIEGPAKDRGRVVWAVLESGNVHYIADSTSHQHQKSTHESSVR